MFSFLDGHTLPLIFAALMAISILAYVILDGYDLGVGMLMAHGDRAERDKMVATIGPFWDANETWLVLGIGLLLVAFPTAHGMVLQALYLPVALMLLGLTCAGSPSSSASRHRPNTSAGGTGPSSAAQPCRP
jgi:cytochrome bd ubiquinol oxidase subunit II